MGKAYGELLKTHPIATKSITSCFMFGLSDFLAQCLKPEKLNLSRIKMACLVGLFYFGPAAHVWYDLMFQLFPEKSFGSTVIKSALGQLLFGPCFMCVFFAASLAQQGSFSWIAYWDKICHDLPPAWITGLGFWPVMSYISYTTVPKDWIPLFSNCCTLLFNIYLSFISYRKGVAQ
jgi:protein Mpv17